MWVLAFLGSTGCNAGPEHHPNILVITMDTTRVDALGCYGNRLPATPFLDSLAARSVQMDRAYTVTPLTIPAHSSLFTGLLPPRHGVRDNGDYFLGDAATTLAERLRGAGYTTMASVGAEVTSHHWGFSQGFDTFDDAMGPSGAETNRWAVERKGAAVVDDAVAWFQKYDRTKPFFAWVHLFDVHHPYQPPEPFRSRFPPYLGEVAYTDSQIQRLFETLGSLGLEEDTWVFFMADHGEGLGSHGEAMHGTLLYDATTHIPMLVHAPGRTTNAHLGFPVSLVDITPTALTAAGLPAAEGLDGVDLSPWIADPTLAPPAGRSVYVESMYASHHYGWAEQRALVDDAYKLIDSTTPELYARSDAREQTNLGPSRAGLMDGMRGRLRDWTAELEPANTASKASQNADAMSQLAALGYVTAEPIAPSSGPPPDPVSKLPVLAKVEAGRKKFQEGDLEGALADLRSVVASDPELREPQSLIGQILIQLGRLDEAKTLIEQLDAAQPGSQTKLILAALAVRQGDPERAIRLYQDALAIDPYLAGAWQGYLSVLFGTGRLDLFEREVNRGLAALPDQPQVLTFHALVLLGRGDRQQAKDELERALVLDPNVVLATHGLALLARVDGRTGDAEAGFLEEIRLHPPAIPSRRELVAMYADQGRYDEQLAQLDEIRKHEPPNAMTLHSTAQALYNLKRYDASKAVIDECRQVAPEYPECALLDANALKKLGREAEAQKAFELAVALKQAQKDKKEP